MNKSFFLHQNLPQELAHNHDLPLLPYIIITTVSPILSVINLSSKYHYKAVGWLHYSNNFNSSRGVYSNNNKLDNNNNSKLR